MELLEVSRGLGALFWRTRTRQRPTAAVALSPAMLVLGLVIAVGAVGNAIPRYSSASPISCRQMPGGCGGLAARRARNTSHTAARAVSTWLGEKRRIYPCKLAYEPSCPFLIHRCVPLSSHDYQRRFWCWETMTQGAVDTCRTPHWNGEHFAAAFAVRKVIFVGDSIADQQWRSLLCLERARIKTAHSALLGVSSAKLAYGKLVCAATFSRGRKVELCHTRQWHLEASLAMATGLLHDPQVILVLSSSAHDRNMTEDMAMRRVLAWRKTVGLVKAALVWRTRGYDHYGAFGFTALARQPCEAVSAEQRAIVEQSEQQHELAAALTASGVALLDAAPATMAAHAAHPVSCREPSDRGGSFYDCRHFCSPGPVDEWNHALLKVAARRTTT